MNALILCGSVLFRDLAGNYYKRYSYGIFYRFFFVLKKIDSFRIITLSTQIDYVATKGYTSQGSDHFETRLQMSQVLCHKRSILWFFER